MLGVLRPAQMRAVAVSTAEVRNEHDLSVKSMLYVKTCGANREVRQPPALDREGTGKVGLGSHPERAVTALSTSTFTFEDHLRPGVAARVAR